jgi:outer membrane receptor protein involved in Fe transport
VEVREGLGGFQPTNLRRPLEGQAPYVFNAGINWANDGGVEAGLFVNRFGDRLEAAGGGGIPDLYEKARTVLDASLGFPLAGGARARIRATNLLDAEYRFEQEANGITQVQRFFQVGRTFSVSLSWEF